MTEPRFKSGDPVRNGMGVPFRVVVAVRTGPEDPWKYVLAQFRSDRSGWRIFHENLVESQLTPIGDFSVPTFEVVS